MGPQDVRALLTAALEAPSGAGRWFLVEGPAGSGASTLLDDVRGAATDRGVACEVLRPPHRPPVRPDVRVLLVEEAQALDASTIAAVPPDAIVVAAVRAGAERADPAALAGLRATTIRLGPLDSHAVAALLGPERAHLGPACAALTGGNAALVAEVADCVAAVDDPVVAPDDLEALLAERLPVIGKAWTARIDRLGADAALLAGVVRALGGEACPLWLAAAVADLPEERAAEAADALVAAGLLEAADPVLPALPLVWRALGAAGDHGARDHAARRRAARALSSTVDGLEAAAEHLLAAPAAGTTWAGVIMADAAALAQRDGRPGDAAVRFERALAEPSRPEGRPALLAGLANARDQAGLEGAEAAYRAALEATPPPERPELHLALGRWLYGAGRYREAAMELDHGLELLTDPDAPIATALLAAYVAAARFDDSLDDAAANHLAPLLRSGVPGRTPAERALLAEVSLERGIRGLPRDEVVALALRAWSNGLLLEGADPYGIALSQVAAALTWSDAFGESEMVLSATIEHADRAGLPALAATASYLRAWPRWYRGDLDGAERDVRVALGAEGWEMYEPSARAVLGHVLVDRGDHGGAAATLVLADESAWSGTVPYAMLLETRSRLRVQEGDLPAAASDLARAGELLDGMGNRSPFAPWRSRLALVRAGLGETAEASELVAVELGQAEAIGTPRALGTALRARAIVDRMADRGDGLDDLRAAADAFEACDARIELARTLTAVGTALVGAGSRVESRAPLRRAVALARETGAARVGEAAQRALHLAGGRAGRAADASPGGLTPSELRVARLAAIGRTNREIAAELVITPHTVRFHLGNAYRKLRVAQRGDIAAALARSRATAGDAS